MIVHAPDIDASPDSGLAVGPGHAADVQFTKVLRKRLPPPHASCSKTWYDAGRDPVGYAKANCENDCYYRGVASQCQCLLLPWPESEPLPAGLYVCSNEEATCIDQVRDDFISGVLDCASDCPERCNEALYDTRLTSQQWPSSVSYGIVLAETQGARGNSSIDRSYVATNMLVVRVFAASAEYQIIETTVAYSFSDLLSDTGGNSGLWVGVSVLTVIEVIEFISLVIAASCCCACAARTATVPDSDHGPDHPMHDGELAEPTPATAGSRYAAEPHVD